MLIDCQTDDRFVVCDCVDGGWKFSESEHLDEKLIAVSFFESSLDSGNRRTRQQPCRVDGKNSSFE